MSGNLFLEINRPHEMTINAHSVNTDVFAINFACREQALGEIKAKGEYPLYYIDAHLTREQAISLRSKLAEFLAGEL